MTSFRFKELKDPTTDQNPTPHLPAQRNSVYIWLHQLSNEYVI